MKRLGCLLAILLSLNVRIDSCATEAETEPGPPAAHKDQTFTEFFRRTSGWVAGDGALSVPLADGRVLWLFGDSHVDDFDPASGTIPCLFQTRNAALLHHTNEFRNARTLIGKGPGFRSWLKISGDGSNEWFWPLCGIQNGNSVWIYLSKQRKVGAGGPWGFESTGHDYWAKIAFPEMDLIRYAALPDFKGITFGHGLVKEGSYVYAFGSRRRGLASDTYVERFKSDQPESDWRFWDGSNWGSAVARAVSIAQGKSTSVHVCKVKNKFLLTTSAFSVACDQGKDIFMATSRYPTGPFSPLKKIFAIDDTFQGHYPCFYFSVAHPEFINPQGELLVTYSINNYEPCIKACVDGRAIPDHYRPKAIRVPLKLIDPDL